MGMQKIGNDAEKEIVRMLRKWPKGRRLTWEALRDTIAQLRDGANLVWTRQALSANENIHSAYKSAKSASTQPAHQRGDDARQTERIRELESELTDIKRRFDLLKLRHAQLIYNASLLEGGTHLLEDPLPDNTKAQQG
jgi:hypothetical protein